MTKINEYYIKPKKKKVTDRRKGFGVTVVVKKNNIQFKRFKIFFTRTKVSLCKKYFPCKIDAVQKCLREKLNLVSKVS